MHKPIYISKTRSMWHTFFSLTWGFPPLSPPSFFFLSFFFFSSFSFFSFFLAFFFSFLFFFFGSFVFFFSSHCGGWSFEHVQIRETEHKHVHIQLLNKLLVHLWPKSTVLTNTQVRTQTSCSCTLPMLQDHGTGTWQWLVNITFTLCTLLCIATFVTRQINKNNSVTSICGTCWVG